MLFLFCLSLVFPGDLDTFDVFFFCRVDMFHSPTKFFSQKFVPFKLRIFSLGYADMGINKVSFGEYGEFGEGGEGSERKEGTVGR